RPPPLPVYSRSASRSTTRTTPTASRAHAALQTTCAAPAPAHSIPTDPGDGDNTTPPPLRRAAGTTRRAVRWRRHHCPRGCAAPIAAFHTTGAARRTAPGGRPTRKTQYAPPFLPTAATAPTIPPR